MNCQDFNHRLFEFAENAVPDAEMVKMQIHIKSCKACNADCNELKGFLVAIENEKQLTPSPLLKQRIMAALPTEVPVRRVASKWISISQQFVAAASIALCIWGGYWVGSIYTSSNANESVPATDELVWLSDSSLDQIDFYVE